MTRTYLCPSPEGVRLALLIQPRSSRDEIVGPVGERLKVRLTAPPLEGRANKALVAFLAKRLGIAGSRVTIIKGHRSRQKEVLVQGLNRDEVSGRLI